MKETIIRRTDSNPNWDPTLETNRSAPEYNYVSSIETSIEDSIVIVIVRDGTSPSTTNIIQDDIISMDYNLNGTICHIDEGKVRKISKIRTSSGNEKARLIIEYRSNNRDNMVEVFTEDIRFIVVTGHNSGTFYHIYCNLARSFFNTVFPADGIKDDVVVYGINSTASHHFTAKLEFNEKKPYFKVPASLLDGVYSLYLISTSKNNSIATRLPDNLGYIFINNEYNLFIPFSKTITEADIDNSYITGIKNPIVYDHGINTIPLTTTIASFMYGGDAYNFKYLSLSSRTTPSINIPMSFISHIDRNIGYSSSFIFYNIPCVYEEKMIFLDNSSKNEVGYNIPFGNTGKNHYGTMEISTIRYQEEDRIPFDILFVGVKDKLEELRHGCSTNVDTISVSYTQTEEHYLPISESQRCTVQIPAEIETGFYNRNMENVVRVQLPNVNNGEVYIIQVSYYNPIDGVYFKYEYELRLGISNDEDTININNVSANPLGIRCLMLDVNNSKSKQVRKLVPFRFDLGEFDSVTINGNPLVDDSKYTLSLVDNDGNTILSGDELTGSNYIEPGKYLMMMNDSETGVTYFIEFVVNIDGTTSLTSNLDFSELHDNPLKTILSIDCYVSDPYRNMLSVCNNSIISFSCSMAMKTGEYTSTDYSQMLLGRTDYADFLTDIDVTDVDISKPVYLKANTFATLNATSKNGASTDIVHLHSDYALDLSTISEEDAGVSISYTEDRTKIIRYSLPLYRLSTVIIDFSNMLDKRYYCITIERNNDCSFKQKSSWISNTSEVFMLQDGDKIYATVHDKIYSFDDITDEKICLGVIRFEPNMNIEDDNSIKFNSDTNHIEIDMTVVNNTISTEV